MFVATKPLSVAVMMKILPVTARKVIAAEGLREKRLISDY